MYMLLAFPPKNTVFALVLPRKKVEVPGVTPILPEIDCITSPVIVELLKIKLVVVILFAVIDPLDTSAHVIVFPIEKLLLVLLKVIPAVALAMPLSLNKT